MEIGDRVQTLNTFTPITGEIVDMYKNLVTIADDDAAVSYTHLTLPTSHCV